MNIVFEPEAPRPISEKQHAANRANARKSTGPVTPEGKARVAANLPRHATLARGVLMRCESPARFRAFVDNFHREYNPRTATEITLVNTMASARWRLMRLGNVEASALDLEYAKLVEPAIVPADFNTADRAAIAYRDLARNSRLLDMVGRAESRLQRQFDAALGRLLRVRANRGALGGEPSQSTPEIEYLEDTAELDDIGFENGIEAIEDPPAA